MAELLKTDKRLCFCFVGEGDLLKDVEQQAAHYNISSHVKLLGWRKDLPAIMKACDVFVFPRQEEPKEGLGLVVVEAQAAGLPMLLSYGILEDAIEIPDLANFITLDNNPAEWAEKL
ncbi:MAG: glycosyltransferase [Saprospiraceae bacterium]|nr:glycosyltransferase [Saprospiraceae bacterium]